ncbi:holin [Mycolicibacterium peregrinum]|uniref:holin n=1 Tax=Mycolicibacterium peregrinum TaxID=43304 RepID=UPI003AAC904A
MDSIWTLRFWKDAAERAIKTFAQSAVIALSGDAFNVWHVDWVGVGGVALGGALLSLLTSIGSNALPFGDKGTASVIKHDDSPTQ